MTIEEIQKSTEFQVFDRKSARIDARRWCVKGQVPDTGFDIGSLPCSLNKSPVYAC